MLVAGASACGGAKKAATTTTGTTSTTTTSTTTTSMSTTTTPPKLQGAAALIVQLLKAPSKGSLPASLQGSTTQATPLSAGSRKHHAAGAIVTTNGGALVGYLVFKSRSDALADLKAFPPNTGPNKLVQRNAPDYPSPSYVLRATGNGYVGRYVVYVDGSVIVNAWAYGQAGKQRERRLLALVESNARWALGRLTRATQAAGFGARQPSTSSRQLGVVHGPASIVPGKLVRFTASGLRSGSTVTLTVTPAGSGHCCGVGIPGSFTVSSAGTAVLVFRFPATDRRCGSTGACAHPAWKNGESVVLAVSGYLEAARATVSIRRATSG
jgi:hypothetical protein